MPNNHLWEHDLWQDIYSINDAETKRAMVRLYRLVLDMRNDEVLAAKIAEGIRKRDKLLLTTGQKIFTGIGAFLLCLDTALHLKQVLGW